MDSEWISVSDMARLRGVSQQAISKRIAPFARAGQLPIKRAGKSKLIHAPTFDALVAATHDPAQSLRNRNVAPSAFASRPAPSRRRLKEDNGAFLGAAADGETEAAARVAAAQVGGAQVGHSPGPAARAPLAEPYRETPAAAPPEPSKFNDAAAREKHAKAELAEMQLAQKRGELVPVREIEAAAIEASTRIAQRLNAMKAAAGKLYAAAKGGEEALHIELLALVNGAIKAVGEDMAQLAARGAPDSDPA